jgi:hypothetical protein
MEWLKARHKTGEEEVRGLHGRAFKKQCPPRLSTRVEDEWDGMARGQGA